jgi:antitoxin (DNA-binding transcriptional repressor) of toxin-antitoxin stability system
MKTATVSDLRNRYTAPPEGIEAGEEIVITQRGKAIVCLVPESPAESGGEEWSESPAVKRDTICGARLNSGRVRRDYS